MGVDEDEDREEELERLAMPWNEDLLPYELVRSSPQYDIWSFGCMLYFMCTGQQLFKSNRDDDITNSSSMIHLAAWSEQMLKDKLSDVYDEAAAEVLEALLQPEAEVRSGKEQSDEPRERVYGSVSNVTNTSFFATRFARRRIVPRTWKRS